MFPLVPPEYKTLCYFHFIHFYWRGTHVFALNIDMDVFHCAVYPSTGLKNTKTGDQFLLPWTVITGDENTSAVLRSYNLCVSHASEGTYG